jgi:1-acyl-sn-glycerol-3-phosphate acyltransferase
MSGVGNRQRRRLTIIAVYVALFWLLLPALLGLAGSAIDRRLGSSMDPQWIGALPAAVGLWIMGSAMWALWRDSRSLPISALPPPKLIRSGPYAHLRHPIYLGFNLTVLGTGLAVGSVGLSAVVAPAFLPLWLSYALIEERGLVKRFGARYRRYRRWAGLLAPRLDTMFPFDRMRGLGILPVRVHGREHLPQGGPAVLVANHACYLDPVFLSAASSRPLHFPTTAEAYRKPLVRWCVRHARAFPVRRYRSDPGACREMVRLLEDGAWIGIFPERERSVLGRWLGPEPELAQILCRLGVPVIPVGIQNNYDAGPRWAGRLRRRRVHLQIGPAIRWTHDPVQDLNGAMRPLLGDDPQLLHLQGLSTESLAKAVWRCPACLEEPGWNAVQLRCEACSRRWQGSPDGLIQQSAGPPLPGGSPGAQRFADWARPVWDAEEAEPLEIPAQGFQEPSVFGPIQALSSLGSGTLKLTAGSVQFGDLMVPMVDLRSVTTERSDTLQIATSTAMWQFRFDGPGAFRSHNALLRWMPRARAPASPPSRAGRRGRAALAGDLDLQGTTRRSPTPRSRRRSTVPRF